MWRVGAVAVLLAILTACGTVPPKPVWPDQILELTEVPFFPQEKYQCGPAALATVLTASGHASSPEALVGEVYVPARQGSLQAEMLAAVRRTGHLPLILAPDFSALVDAVRAGYPVLVLQNLGVSWWPQWHYAVVVGMDPARQKVVLRSGIEQRKLQSIRSFMHTWARSQHWAMVVAQPNVVPDWAEMKSWLMAAQALVDSGGADAGTEALEMASEHWPDQALPWLLLGNRRYQQGRWAAAADAFHRAQLRDPGSVAASNNLASVLIELGCPEQATEALDKAASVSATNSLTRVLEQTRDELRRARSAGAVPCRLSTPGS